MSLSRYKWTRRFGELREWLSKSSWDDLDTTEFNAWLVLTRERFEAHFLEQAIPYIQSHPNRGRLVIDVDASDPHALLLVRAFPNAHLNVSLSTHSPDITLEMLEQLAHAVTTLGIEGTWWKQERYCALPAVLSRISLPRMTSIRVGGFESFLGHDASSEVTQHTDLIVTALLQSLGDNRCLEHLMLFYCGLSEEAVLQIVSTQWPSLKKLNLLGNDLTNSSILALAQAESLKGLERLSFENHDALSLQSARALYESPNVSQALFGQWTELQYMEFERMPSEPGLSTLEAFRACCAQNRSPQFLADDVRFPTDDLVAFALEFILDDDATGVYALYALQKRADESVRHAAYGLLDSPDADERIMGSRILYGMHEHDLAPHEHSLEVIEALTRAIEREEDDQALDYYLSAIGKQVHPTGLEVLLQFVDDPRPSVRETVADYLLIVVTRGGDDATRATTAMIALAADPNPDVAGSTLWDVGEYPDMFEHVAELFVHAARTHEHNTNRTGLDARRVIDALGSVSNT